MNMPADWAIEEALSDIQSPETWRLSEVKKESNLGWARSVLALARMIEKYETHRKPVDPALAIVRELFASNFKFIGGADITVQGYREGHYDNKPTFQAFLAKYKELHP